MLPTQFVTEPEIITADISAAEYIAGYRDKEKFGLCCKECGNYGTSWLCPPFSYDIDACLRPWTKVHIAGISLLVPCRTPIAEALTILHPARVALSEYLLSVERTHAGMALGFSGHCLYCSHCSRQEGDSCRHPEKARPSLEAYGFDVEATALKLLGIKLEWGKDVFLPERLSLIGAVFIP